MEQYIIKGGTPLMGEVNISGAKNAALGVLAGALLTDDIVTLENVPDVSDIRVLLEAMEGIGAFVERVDKNTYRLSGKGIHTYSVEYDYIKKIRASYYLLGSLLGKYNEANVAMPGGCEIGSRPIDQHLKGFRLLGAKVDIDHGMISAKAEELAGNHVYFDMVTVGATINVMLAAVLAKGNTILENAAKEPHVVDVANFLNCMGANIKGAGTDVIRIKGVDRLHGCTYSIVPDQIEAGTFMFAAAATNGKVLINNVIPRHLESLSAKLVEIGCSITEYDDAVLVEGTERLGHTQVKTLPYPGFPTDMQPQMTVLLSVANGLSVVTESIFENRFRYVDELNRMGANIKADNSMAVIDGVEKLFGAHVSAPDLRAGAALVIAGLMAESYTVVDGLTYILRGYEDFDLKLRNLGAKIEKVDSEEGIRKFKLKVG